jgi:hypothetical protein
VATDQHQLVQDYDVPVRGADVDQSVAVADRLLGRYGAGQIASLSFDKRFTRAADREVIGLYVPIVVMPKRGKKTAVDTEYSLAASPLHGAEMNLKAVICEEPVDKLAFVLFLKRCREI